MTDRCKVHVCFFGNANVGFDSNCSRKLDAKGEISVSLENLTCFGCGGKGHIEHDCPKHAAAVADAGPPLPRWCEHCDRRTRLIEIRGVAARCQECHPLARQGLAQHPRCPDCRMIVFQWDRNPCGKHVSPVNTTDSRLPREEIDAIIAANSKDAA